MLEAIIIHFELSEVPFEIFLSACYHLNNLIEEILLNASFSNLNKVPQNQVKAIMGDLLSTFSVYLEYEEKHSELVETML